MCIRDSHSFEQEGELQRTAFDMSKYFVSKVGRFEEEREVHLRPVESPYCEKIATPQLEHNLVTPGIYAQTCNSHLMALLYGCRMAGPALSIAIMRLTRFVTKWMMEQDRCLVRVFAWLKFHCDYILTGELSAADWDFCVVRSWPDSDLAGDYMTSKSTASLFIELAGLEGRGYPIAWSCKTTGESSDHTQEAETVALSYSTKYEAMPIQQLLSKLMCRKLDPVSYTHLTLPTNREV